MLETLKRTRTEFDVYAFQVLAGFGFLIGVAAIEFVLATRITDAITYDSLRDGNADVNTSTSGFLFVTVFLTLILAFVVARGSLPRLRKPYRHIRGEQIDEVLDGLLREDQHRDYFLGNRAGRRLGI